MRYLREELDAYVLKGYTKVADNSFPNLLPVFTGLKAYTKEVPPGIDNIPFIWKNFSRKGYIDHLSEDHPGSPHSKGSTLLLSRIIYVPSSWLWRKSSVREVS